MRILLAAEMAAFANANGGIIFIGVQDDGTPSGITSRELHDANQLIGNAASQHVRSPLVVQTQNILLKMEMWLSPLTVPLQEWTNPTLTGKALSG